MDAHLEAFRLGARQRRRVTEAAVVGAIVARGLLTDTVIVSDDAGQFDVLTHALCWVHAERHLRRLVCATAEQRRLVDLQRQLVWWLYADLKLYKDEPTAARRAALRARFDRVFGRVTGFAELDATVARLRANKDELLVVLDRPEIPLHTQRLGERHPLRRHQAQDLRRDPLRGRQAGARHLPRPAQDLRQARGVVLGLPRRPPQDPRGRCRPVAARPHPATGVSVVRSRPDRCCPPFLTKCGSDDERDGRGEGDDGGGEKE